MGFSDLDSGCKRHPIHNQVPGVCPACLRERLSKLDSSANNSYKTAKSTISNASSSCISTSSSTPTYSTTSSSSTRVFLHQAAAAASTAPSKNRAIAKNNNTNIRPRGQQNHRRTGSDTGVPLGLVLNYGSSKGVRSTSTYKEGAGSVKGIKGSSTNTAAGSAASGLKKSRSVACAPRIYRGGSRHGKRGGGGGGGGGGDSESTRLRDESRSRSSHGGGSSGVVDSDVEDDLKGNSGNTSSRGKKGGFWKKLIHSTSKKSKGVLTHSKSTLKERSGHHQQL